MKDAKNVYSVAPQDVQNALNGVQAVVTDLDGTLYTKGDLARRLVAHLWWALPLILIDRLARGAAWRWVVRTRWHQRIYLPTMARLIGHYCPVRNDVLELLLEAHRRELPIALYSDYGAIDAKLQALGIAPSLFTVMVSAPELGARKPDPQAAEQVLRLLNANPANTLWVGDRDDTDGVAARSIGATFMKV